MITMPTSIPDRQNDIDAVGSLLQRMLEAVIGTYEQANVELPKRRYVTYGLAAADCEQVTVACGQIYNGLPGSDPNQVQRCDGPRTCTMVVTIFRKDACGSGPRGQGVPTPDSLTANALVFARDAWLLLDACKAVDAAGLHTGVISEVSPIDASGGYVGATMNVTITVP